MAGDIGCECTMWVQIGEVIGGKNSVEECNAANRAYVTLHEILQLAQ